MREVELTCDDTDTIDAVDGGYDMTDLRHNAGVCRMYPHEIPLRRKVVHDSVDVRPSDQNHYIDTSITTLSVTQHKRHKHIQACTKQSKQLVTRTV